MKKNEINNLLEYLSLALIMSYIFVHNIFLVLLGIILSLFLINSSFINTIIDSNDKKLVSKKVSKELNESDKNIKDYKTKVNPEKDYSNDSNITLVEIIEEIGYIPSLDRTNNKKAA